jgi:tetratricopeptide (TPR) repeat protein
VSDPSEATAVELLDLSLPDLRRSIAAGRTGSPAQLAESLRKEAGRYYHTDAAAARKVARRALDVGEISEDLVALGWGHRAMAEALLFSGRPAEADLHYERAAAAWRESKQGGFLGQLLVARVGVLALLGRHQQVEETALEARRLLSAAGDRAYLAKLAMNLGSVRFEREQFGPALEEYDRAAKLFKELGVRDESVIGLEINRGLAMGEVNRDEEAVALYERLEKECDASGYELYLAQVRMNAAYVHSQRADFDRALKSLVRATDYFRRVEHPAYLASCYLNRAEIYHQLNLHRESLELTRQAGPLFTQVGLVHDRGLSLSQEALSSLALGRLNDALRMVRAARRVFLKAKNPPRVALMELFWAEVLSKRKSRRSEAEAKVRQALATFRQLGLLRWEAAAAVLLSELEGERVAPSQQIVRLRGLLERLPPRIYPIPAYRLLEALGGAQERSGMPRAAESTYRRALGHLEDLRTRIPTEDSKIAFLQDKTQLYHRMIALELARPRPSLNRIFEWMERSRAQSLWDRMRAPGSYLEDEREEEARDGEGRRLVALRRRLSWMHARLSRLELGSASEQAQAAVLRRALSQAEREWSRGLREAMEARSRRPRGGQGASPESEGDPYAVPTVAEMERRLPEGWGFVSFHLGPDFGLVAAITANGSTWRPLRPDLRKRLAALSQALEFQWASITMTRVRRTQVARGGGTVPPALAASERGLRDAADGLLRQIHGLIWEPIDQLGAAATRGWVVAPHGPIHRVPFAALRDRSGYLIERTDLSTTPSARIWSRLERPLPAHARRAWIAGVPSAQLPGVEAEMARVRDRLEGWTTVLDASPRRNTFRTEGAEAGVVHLAAHGALRIDNPAYSFVELADGPLFVHDLGRSRFPGSTVVLTACSSGRGAAPAGEEWVGLARGFLQAGAGAVVASLWAIHEEPTLELIDSFYRELASGAPVPQALGSAMRGRIPHGAHPWEWAAFGALGGIWMRGRGE